MKDFAQSLRLLADHLEAHPELQVPSTTITCYAEDTKENAATTLRALTPCEKEYVDTLFKISRVFGSIKLEYIFMRNAVCIKKVVGQKEIPAKHIPEQFLPARTEDIIEWECEPILQAAQPTPAHGLDDDIPF